MEEPLSQERIARLVADLSNLYKRVEKLEGHLFHLSDLLMEMVGRVNAHLSERREGDQHLSCSFKGKVIYVAGPLSGDVVYNTAVARMAAHELAQKGHCPVVPHTNFDYAPMDEWRAVIRLCLVILHRVDAVYFLPGWKQSIGSVIEFYCAHALYRTCYFDMKDVPDMRSRPDPAITDELAKINDDLDSLSELH